MDEVGAAALSTPTLGFEAVMLPEMGKGLAAETPCSLPLPSMVPISIAVVGAATPVIPSAASVVGNAPDPPPPSITT